MKIDGIFIGHLFTREETRIVFDALKFLDVEGIEKAKQIIRDKVDEGS